MRAWRVLPPLVHDENINDEATKGKEERAKKEKKTEKITELLNTSLT